MYIFLNTYQTNNENDGGEITMASSKNKQAQETLNKFKMEVASQIGVNLKQGYNGDLTSKQAGSIGGEMVKRMIEKAAGQM